MTYTLNVPSQLNAWEATITSQRSAMDRTDELIRATQLFSSIDFSKSGSKTNEPSSFILCASNVSSYLDGNETLVRRMNKLWVQLSCMMCNIVIFDVVATPLASESRERSSQMTLLWKCKRYRLLFRVTCWPFKEMSPGWTKKASKPDR